jgi:hypothetical protein
MINQQRELHMQREASLKNRQTERPPRTSGDGDTEKERLHELLQDSAYWGWKNVAAGPSAGPKLPDYGNRSRFNSIAAVTVASAKEPEDHPFMERDKFDRARTMFERKAGGESRNENAPSRARSRTNPDVVGFGPAARPPGQRRAARSVDRRSGAGMPVPRSSLDGPGPGPGPRMERRRSRGLAGR